MQWSREMPRDMVRVWCGVVERMPVFWFYLGQPWPEELIAAKEAAPHFAGTREILKSNSPDIVASTTAAFF